MIETTNLHFDRLDRHLGQRLLFEGLSEPLQFRVQKVHVGRQLNLLLTQTCGLHAKFESSLQLPPFSQVDNANKFSFLVLHNSTEMVLLLGQQCLGTLLVHWLTQISLKPGSIVHPSLGSLKYFLWITACGVVLRRLLIKSNLKIYLL